MRHDAIALAVIVSAALLPLGARAQGECPRDTYRQGDVCLPAAAEASVPATYPTELPPPPPAEVPAAAGVPVRFEMDDASESYVVAIDLPGAPSCRTPCELLLPPGKVHARFVGSKVFAKKLKIPDRPAVVRVQLRSSLGTGLGIAGVVVGSATAIGSYGYMLVSMAERADAARGQYSDEAHLVMGLGGMAIGTAVVVGSVISGLVVNRTRVPVRTDESRAASSGPRLVGLSAVPMREGGVVVGAAFEF